MAKRRYHEGFEAGGLRVERLGRFVRMQNVRSADEHRELLRRGAEYHSQAPEQIGQRVAELEAILERYDPFDVIANVSFMNMSMDPETYKEWAHEGQQACVEHVTLLCLKRPYHTAGDPRDRLIDGPTLKDIQNRLEQIHWNTIWFHGTRHMDPERQESPSPIEELQFKTVLHELGVRNPGYPQHLDELLRGLFSPLSQWMDASLGFSSGDAISLVHAIGRMLNSRLAARIEEARAAEKDLRQQVRAFRGGKPLTGKYSGEMLAKLARLRDDEMRRAIRDLVVGCTFFALGDTYAFTAEELAAEAERPADRAQAFLDRMAIGFGEIDKDFSMPTTDHPLRVRPIVHHDGRYLCPVVGLLMWGLRPALEGMLKTDRGLWQRYQRARSKYLETRSLEFLSQALGGAPHYRGLKFPSTRGQSEGELDGLLTYDRCLFLVECKAGAFGPAARRGAAEPMLHGLKDLVADAHSQALKARRYISAADTPTFEAEDGTTVTIDKEHFNRVFLITTALEPLDPFTPVLHKVRDLGIFEEGDLPWAVYLLDLRVVSELVEFPAQLIHYLDRRLRLHEAKHVEVGDELDWFGYYLHEGLSLTDLRAWDADKVQLGTFTTSMDDYFLHQIGERQTPAPRPAQPLPKTLRQIIAEVEAVHAEGYVDVVCYLLDMGGEARKRFVKSVEKIRERSRRDGGDHNFFALSSEAGFGLCVFSGLATALPQLIEQMQVYSSAKKYQTKMNTWVGLVSHLALPGLVHAWFLLRDPWQFDKEMEDAVAKLFTPGPTKR